MLFSQLSARPAADLEQLRVGVVPADHLGEPAQQRPVERSLGERGAEQLGVLLGHGVVAGPCRAQVHCQQGTVGNAPRTKAPGVTCMTSRNSAVMWDWS
jgi:hypothetical protein